LLEQPCDTLEQNLNLLSLPPYFRLTWLESGVLRYRDRILRGGVLSTTLWLAWPIILANLVNISYNLVDAFWLGKLGASAFSAPTVSWPLIMFLHSVGMGLSFAGVTLISQYVGAGSAELARKSTGMFVGFMGSVSAVVMTIGLTLSPTLLKLMQIPPDVYPVAVNYITIIFAGEPLIYMGFTFTSIVNGLGDTKTPTYLGIVSSLLNMVLDPILIFGWFGAPAMGVSGAALATIASRGLVGVAGLYLLVKGFRGLKIGLRDIRVEGWWLKKVVRVGGPLAIQHSANSLGFVVMASIVSRFGSAVIAAYGFGIRVIDIIQAFTWGVMRATSIMIGQNVGAEEYDRAERIVRRNLALISATLALGALAIVAFREQLISFFISDPAVVSEGSRFVLTFAPSIPFFGMFFVVGAVARGSGHTLPFTVISIIRLWLLRVGLSYILAGSLGPLGIWLAMSVSNLGAGLISVAWVLRGTWKKRVIEIPRAREVLAAPQGGNGG